MVGPLPRSKAGHKYILTICDYSSRYKAISNRLTANIRGGSTHTISHMYRHPTGDTHRLWNKLHLKIDEGAPQSPWDPCDQDKPVPSQTDGLVERFNATMKSMIWKVIQKFDKGTPIPHVSTTARRVYRLFTIQTHLWCRGQSGGRGMVDKLTVSTHAQ